MTKYRLLTRYGTSDVWNVYGTYNATASGILRLCTACVMLGKFGATDEYNIDIEILDE